MIRYKSVFNKNTLNIFTDASTTKVKDEIIAAPGYIAVIDDIVVNKEIEILRDTSISEAELFAIYMAIQYAVLNTKRVYTINIFSDSQFSVYGLREWIFKWVNNIRNDKLYNSSGKEVAHQNLFMAIIYTILQYDLQVSFFHNRGHFNYSQINEFIDLFTKHNFLSDNIDREMAKTIIYYNDRIDNETRFALKKGGFPPKLIMPEYLARKDLDLDQYKKLLNI